MDGPLIHIGYHKAASTVLQDQFFTDPSSPFRVPPEPRHMLVQRFVVPQPMTFDVGAAQAHYAEILQQAEQQGQTAVLSHERFSGYPPSGGFDCTIIANRLQRTFPQARILIVVREQVGNIFSMYSQYITDGGDMSLKDYLARPQPFLKRVPVFSEEFYRYHRLLSLYRQKFGADRVLCLPFEQLVKQPDEFVGQIYDFAGQPRKPHTFRRQNAKRSATFQVLQRLVNQRLSGNELIQRRRSAPNRVHRQFGAVSRYLGPRMTGWLDRALEDRMQRFIAAEFQGDFAESNAILSQMIGRDLGDFGYQMPDDFTPSAIAADADQAADVPQKRCAAC